jgi:hypothetical protein
MADENLDNLADTETGAVPEKGSSKPSLMDILNASDNKEDAETEDEQSEQPDDDTEPGESTTDDEQETEEEVDETEEEEVEVEDEAEVDETLNASFSGLKKAYPDIFKKFPSLRNKIGREYAFSELYPTLDDARVANTKAEVFDHFNNEFNSGNAPEIIKALPDLKTAEKFAEGILPALRAAHPDLLTKAVDPFVRMMLNKIDKDASNSGDKNLGLAAKYISKYLYGKAEIPGLPVARTNEPDPEKEALKAQLSQVQQRDYYNFESSTNASVVRVLDREIKTLIDPKDTMSPKMQQMLISQVINELDEELKSNPSHMAKMRAFKEKALRSGLGAEHQSRMRSAYLQAARPALRTISQRIKAEAFGKKNGVSKNTEARAEGKKVIPSSSVGNGKQPSVSANKVTAQNVKNLKAKGLRMEDILA